MNTTSNVNTQQTVRLDPYSLLRDILRNLPVILLGALAVAMIAYMTFSLSYERTYTTNATFVVTSKTYGNNVYRNLSATQTAADTFSNILNSSVLQKKVCQDLGMDSFDATTEAKVIAETNLLTLSVTADTPQKTYSIMRSIMKTYSELTQYVAGSMVMTVLQEPQVPTGADNLSNALRRARRFFVYSFLVLVGVFALLSFYHDTVKSERDLSEKLDAKHLGMIYHERQYKSLSSFLRRKKNGVLVSNVTTSFEFVERYKKIAARILNFGGRDARVILVTSATSGEGVTTAAANLAIILAQRGDGQVLLMDCNMRRPHIADLMNVKVRKNGSVVDFLQGNAKPANVLCRTGQQDLMLMLNKEPFAGSTDLLASERTRQYFGALRRAFRYVVIDAPAMDVASDTEVLAELADLTVLVVEYDRMEAEDINDTIDAIGDCHAEIAGCILNNVRTLPGSRRTTGAYGYGYGYGYGSYGKYGKYGSYGKYGRYERKTQSTANAAPGRDERREREHG